LSIELETLDEQSGLSNWQADDRTEAVFFKN